MALYVSLLAGVRSYFVAGFGEDSQQGGGAQQLTSRLWYPCRC
jgi:hypothetical protein